MQQNSTTRTVTIGASTDGTVVDVSGTSGNRTVTGVNAGAVTAASTDAVNGSQLYATNQQVATNTSAIATLTGQVSTNTSDIAALNSTVAGLSATNSYVRVNSSAAAANASGTDAIAIGLNSASTGVNAIAIGTGAVATGSVAGWCRRLSRQWWRGVRRWRGRDGSKFGSSWYQCFSYRFELGRDRLGLDQQCRQHRLVRLRRQRTPAH